MGEAAYQKGFEKFTGNFGKNQAHEKGFAEGAPAKREVLHPALKKAARPLAMVPTPTTPQPQSPPKFNHVSSSAALKAALKARVKAEAEAWDRRSKAERLHALLRQLTKAAMGKQYKGQLVNEYSCVSTMKIAISHHEGLEGEFENLLSRLNEKETQKQIKENKPIADKGCQCSTPCNWGNGAEHPW